MTNNQLTVREDMPLANLGEVLAKSGFFADTREAGQAIVKVLAGREMGFGPIASMTGINIIKGRVSLSANLMASAVKRSGRYDYKVIENTVSACEIVFYENGKASGNSRFTMDDARKAGTQNLEKFPRNMLFARAMSNGVRWYCPDVTNGPAYTPEELGAAVDEQGDVITGTATEVKEEKKPVDLWPANLTICEACGKDMNDVPHHRDQFGKIICGPVKNGKAAPDLAAYRARYHNLVATAVNLGITPDELPVEATADEIIAAGKSLKNAIQVASEPQPQDA